MDLEAGGTNTQHSLLSAYFVVLDEDLKTVYGELDLKIKPNDGNYTVRAEALDINKIDLIQHDKEAVTESKAATLLYEFLETHAAKGTTKLTPLGHGIAVDIEFIKERLTKNFNQFVSYRYLDTGCIIQFLKLTGKVSRDLGGSLKELADYFEVPIHTLHTAKADTWLVIEVLRKLVDF
jgi:DNA polymerase III alpha subunit (gram-positive type)